jgi:hypothetical protein
MMTGLFDAAPEPADQAATAAPAWRPRPLPTGPELIADNLRRRAGAAHHVARGLPELPARLHTLRALTADARTRSAAAPALAGPVGSRRRMAVLRLPLAALRRAAHDRQVTINDLLLAAVTAGLHDLLSRKGECRPDLVLRASVPVGAHDRQRRRDAGRAAAGGRRRQRRAAAPDLCADPLAQATPRRGDRRDAVHAAEPGPARRAVARHTAPSHINLYVTNVPGPRQPLYLPGAQIADVAPLAPLVAGVPLSVTALSYSGVLAVSLLADPTAVDLTMLAAGVRRGFDDYLRG